MSYQNAMAVFVKGLIEIDQSVDPDCYSWWANQSINMIEEFKEDFQEFYEINKNDQTICTMMARSILSEIKSAVRFHKIIKSQVEARELLGEGNDIYWRLKKNKNSDNSVPLVTTRRIMETIEKTTTKNKTNCDDSVKCVDEVASTNKPIKNEIDESKYSNSPFDSYDLFLINSVNEPN